MPATIGLMVLIGLAYIYQTISGGTRDFQVAADLGAIIPGTLEQGEYWRLLAAMFLHFGIFHVAVNLWALFQLGGLFEVMFGWRRFVFTYFTAGLIASFTSASFIAERTVAAGASGAIFGVLGALIPAIRQSPRFRHQAWARGLMQQLMVWAGINVVIGFTFPGIDNAAHLGGFAAGLLLGLIPHKVPPPPPGRVTIDGDDYVVRDDERRM